MTDETKKILDESAADAPPQDGEASADDRREQRSSASAEENTLDETAAAAASVADKPAASELPAAAPEPAPERYIVLDRVYRARGVQAIAKGVYALNDPRLVGRGLYLLRNRIAFEVDGPDVEPEPEADADAPDAGDESFVVLMYVGANKQAHPVKARGQSFEVPRLMKDADGRAQLRTIRVPAELADEFIGRGTFQKVR